jgi:MFS transporter, FSR family, fosmidomycin resistance protein
LSAVDTGIRKTTSFLLLLSLTHGMVDLSSGAIVGLLPALAQRFSLSYTMVGTIMLVSSLTSSFTQPFFGLLSDRSSKRWLLPVSLLLSGLGIAAVGYMPTYWLMLAAVVLSALGTATFHPEGAHAAGHLAAGRKARALSIYSVGGNIGYSLAPIYTGLLLMLGSGTTGLGWALVLPALLAAFIFRRLPRWEQLEATYSTTRHIRTEDLPANNWTGAALLTLLVIVRSMINTGMTTYVPFFWTDVLGHGHATAKYVQVMYMAAGVFGTLFGAPLSDRIGTKQLLAGSFALLLPLQILLPFLDGWLMLAALFTTGFVVVTTFTTTLVMIQEYMPRRVGLASGLNLGLGFGMGGVGAQLLGVVSDHWGVTAAMYAIAALVPFALLLAFTLPKGEDQARIGRVQEGIRQA